MNLECSQCLRKGYSSAESDEIRKILDVPIIDCIGFLFGWIGAQRTCSGASSTAANPLRMVNASHQSQDRLTLAKQIPRQAKTWFPINRRCMSKTFKGCRVGRDHNAIQRITGSIDERAYEEATLQLGRGRNCSCRNYARINRKLICSCAGSAKRG